MKQITQFLKTSAMGGLLVLLPLLLLYLVISELVKIVVVLATPIAALFPDGTFAQVNHPVFWALILILVVSFLLGLTLRIALLRRLGDWAEKTILMRIPAYSAIKQMSRGLVGAGDEDTLFKPALWISGEEERRIAYLVEDHEDGYVTILVPQTPTAFSGDLVIVPKNNIEILTAGLGEASAAISHWGVGFRKLLPDRQSREIN